VMTSQASSQRWHPSRLNMTREIESICKAYAEQR
jgi:hypothetical protein